MNLIEMRIMVRRDLRDEDASNYRWTDDALDRHIAHAAADISGAVPLEEKTLLATVAGSREIDISSLGDYIVIQALEYPADRFPASYQRFSLWGGALTLAGDVVPDGSDARIYYGRRHILTAQASTIPAYLEDLLAIGAEGYACIEWAGYAVNRVNTGGSLTPQGYERLGQARLDFFRKELRRLGRNNRVRPAQLYCPAAGAVSGMAYDWRQEV